MSTIVTRNKIDNSGLHTGLNQAKGHVRKFRTDVGSMMKGGIAVAGIVAGGAAAIRVFRDLVKNAGDFAETKSKIDAIFGKAWLPLAVAGVPAVLAGIMGATVFGMALSSGWIRRSRS